MPLFRLLVLSLFLFRTASASELPFYVGTLSDASGSKGIYYGTLDSVTGKLGPLSVAYEMKNPNFLALAPNGKSLYAAVNTANGSSIVALAVQPDGTLKLLNERPAGGAETCHVSVDGTGHVVFAANYTGGNIAAFSTLPDGSLDQRTAYAQFSGSGPNLGRQKKPYAHSIYAGPGNKFVYSCDLGSDNVWSFQLDAAKGTLTPTDPPSAKVPPGSGPRHLVFGGNGKFVYVANEMGLSVSVFSRDAATGKLTLIDTTPTLMPGAPTEGVTVAEIALHPSGKWLYVSNRGGDTIAVFAVAADGKLTLKQNAPSVVKFPRNFALDPTGTWLITAGQKDNRIAVLKIDPATGELSATDQTASVPTPVCVLFKDAF